MLRDNPIVGDKYKEFVEAMKECAKEENLPQAMEINNIEGITLDSIEELMYMFNHDTGLEMTMSGNLCPDCGCMHCFLIVDYPEEDEDTVLQ